MFSSSADESEYFGARRPVAELTPGQRIRIAGRPGTFIGYWRIANFPNVIEWVPDGKLEVEVTIWTWAGVEISSFEETDAVDPMAFDIDYWEAKVQ